MMPLTSLDTWYLVVVTVEVNNACSMRNISEETVSVIHCNFSKLLIHLEWQTMDHVHGIRKSSSCPFYAGYFFYTTHFCVFFNHLHQTGFASCWSHSLSNNECGVLLHSWLPMYWTTSTLPPQAIVWVMWRSIVTSSLFPGIIDVPDFWPCSECEMCSSGLC